MENSIEAVYDGNVLCPDRPLDLEPNTRVRIHIEAVLPKAESNASFLRVARSLHLERPPDWSENIESYLYGDRPNDGR